MGFVKNIIASFFKNPEDRTRLYKVVLPSFAVHFFAAILGIILVIVMTKGLGKSDYGIFSFSFSVIGIVVNLATYGLCALTVRETPSLLSKGQTGMSKGLYKWSVKLIIVLCISFALIAAGYIAFTAFYLHIYKQTDYIVPLLLALISVPVYGLMNYYSASLRGRYKIVLSLLPDNIIKPAIFLVCLGLLHVFFLNFNATTAILANAIAYLFATVFAIAAFYKVSAFNGITAEYNKELWKNTFKSFLLLLILTSIDSRMDILMLGYLKTPAHVGVYSAAEMLGTKLVVFQQIMNFISAPSISRMHTLEEKEKLQSAITKISKGVVLISFPVFLVLIIFSKYIMSYFGPGFGDGQMVLIIITIGQLVNLIFGPVGNLSIMTGNQRYLILFTAVSLVINFSVNLLLTPAMGINGTAIAFSTSLIAWNVGMFFTIRKKVGIRTWIFG